MLNQGLVWWYNSHHTKEEGCMQQEDEKNFLKAHIFALSGWVDA
jgi:hypothetical protein